MENNSQRLVDTFSNQIAELKAMARKLQEKYDEITQQNITDITQHNDNNTKSNK